MGVNTAREPRGQREDGVKGTRRIGAALLLTIIAWATFETVTVVVTDPPVIPVAVEEGR